jgi:hypothetical protein
MTGQQSGSEAIARVKVTETTVGFKHLINVSDTEVSPHFLALDQRLTEAVGG